MHTPIKLAALAGSLLWSAFAPAADWNTTGVWLLHGTDFELGEARRSIMRIEHADGWAYGDNYFFYDIIQPDTGGTSFYGELSPRFSINRILGNAPGEGLVKEFLVSTSVNHGTDFRAWLYGLAVDFNVPGFAYLQLNAYVRDDAGQPGRTWQITPVWLYPFAIGPARFAFQGFIDYAGSEGAARSNLVAYPRLWWDAGALFDVPNRLEIGIEYIYWNNKFGVDGVDERVIEPMLRWTF